MKNKPLLFLFLVFIASKSYGKVCLVSDIDDTIKITHTEKILSLSNVAHFFANLPFAGASTLFSHLVCEQEVCGEFNEEIFYLTASPNKLEFMQKSFLERAMFPPGHFLARPSSLGTYEYKLEATENFIKELGCEETILIGDDSSEDSRVYGTISSPKNVYIHSLYRNYIEPGQTRFFTFADLALRLWEDDHLSYESLIQTLESIVKTTYRYRILPTWVNCHPDDLLTSFQTSKPIEDEELDTLDSIYKRASRSCYL